MQVEGRRTYHPKIGGQGRKRGAPKTTARCNTLGIKTATAEDSDDGWGEWRGNNNFEPNPIPDERKGEMMALRARVSEEIGNEQHAANGRKCQQEKIELG
jgi:hypothetical protein